MKAINIILDSVGYEQYQNANTHHLDQIQWNYRGPAETHTNTTPASVLQFMRGRIPYVNGREQIYGKPLSLPLEMRDNGNYTYFASSLTPLLDNDFNVLRLKNHFDFYKFYEDKLTPQGLVCSDKILSDAKDSLRDHDDYFAYLHLGETHYNWDYKNPDGSLNKTNIKGDGLPFAGPYFYMRHPEHMISYPATYIDYLKCRQRECIGYLDGLIGPFLDGLEPDILVVTADHGTGWGEKGIWLHDHGWNSEIMTVPLLLKVKQ